MLFVFREFALFFFRVSSLSYLPFLLCWYLLLSDVESESSVELARRVLVLPLCSCGMKNGPSLCREGLLVSPGRWVPARRPLSGHCLPTGVDLGAPLESQPMRGLPLPDTVGQVTGSCRPNHIRVQIQRLICERIPQKGGFPLSAVKLL